MIPVDGFICFQSYSCICEYSDELYYVKALHHLYVLACSACTVPMTILVSDWTETSQLWPSIMCRCLVFVHILCQFFRSLSTNISTTLIFQTHIIKALVCHILLSVLFICGNWVVLMLYYFQFFSYKDFNSSVWWILVVHSSCGTFSGVNDWWQLITQSA